MTLTLFRMYLALGVACIGFLVLAVHVFLGHAFDGLLWFFGGLGLARLVRPSEEAERREKERMAGEG
jgi:hypothetical protein